MGNVLDACYNQTMPDFEPQTLSITVADTPGVLNHVRPPPGMGQAGCPASAFHALWLCESRPSC